MPTTSFAPDTHAEGVDAEGRTFRFREKRAALSLAIDESTVYTFERTGRLYGAFRGRVNYRRGLDNRVLAKRPAGERGRHETRVLSAEEAGGLLAAIHADVLVAGEVLAGGPAASTRWLGRIADWTPRRLAESGRTFGRVYSPVGILPPDQYMALVVQTSQGCRWNQCTFCHFYRDITFQVKSERELREHLSDVVAFLGEGLALRRSLFLGDADALAGGYDHTAQCQDTIRTRLGEVDPSLGGAPVYGFAEALSILALSERELAGLADRGLRRLYIGLETGDDALRRRLRKRGVTAQAIRAVDRLHAAGLSAGIIVLAGLGQGDGAHRHVEATLDALGQMQTGKDDLVYLSPLIDPEEGNGTPAQAQSAREELDRLRDGLGGIGGRVAVYDVGRFIY